MMNKHEYEDRLWEIGKEISERLDEGKAVTVSMLFEVLVRVGLLRKTETRLKQSTCERIQNETGGAVVAHWLRLYDRGYRATEPEVG